MVRREFVVANVSGQPFALRVGHVPHACGAAGAQPAVASRAGRKHGASTPDV